MNTLSSLLELIANIFTTNGNYEISGKDTRETITSLTEAMYMRAGSIIVWPGPISTIPEGWHLCDGTSYSITGYADLFTALGEYLSPYGVNVGESLFNIPNVQGRSITGFEQGNTNYNQIGKKGGSDTVTITTQQLPVHYHQVPVWAAEVADNGNNFGPVPTGKAGQRAYRRQDLDENTGNAGGGQPHPNLSPYIVMNWIIKLY